MFSTQVRKKHNITNYKGLQMIDRNKFIGQKVLMTTTAWFHAGGETTYGAIWGTLKAIHSAEDVLGFKQSPRAGQANWVYEIGDMMIMGCQVNYCKLQPVRPYDGEMTSWHNAAEHGTIVTKRPNSIYFCEE